MSDQSKIEWTDATWNPVRGCSRVSTGCEKCYAERVASRFSRKGLPYYGLARMNAKGEPRWTGRVELVEGQLEVPLHWKRPRKIFVNSMSDLFHEALPDEAIARVFDVIRRCSNERRGHVFQILTKRPERMLDVMQRLRFDGERPEGEMTYVADSADAPGYPLGHGHRGATGLTNYWLGVSCENQETADERIPLLGKCPAKVKFVSAEPLLGPLSLLQNDPEQRILRWYRPMLRHVDWLIVGGESGPGARPFDLAWARSIQEQCKSASVAYFFKQAGSAVVDSDRDRGRFAPDDKRSIERAAALGRSDNPPALVLFRDRKGGDIEELPKNMRVREWPAVKPGSLS